MKVEMNVTTNYSGLKEAGQQYDVESEVAYRWADRGIATILNDIIDVDGKELGNGAEEGTEDVAYDEMSAKDLYALAKERGLDPQAKMTKEYYIDLLNA